MPNDTPDYQPGANYVAVPQPRLPIDSLHPGPFNVNLAAYSSVMLVIGAGGFGVTITATWLDANGNQIAQFPLQYPNTGTFYLKLPVAGPTLQLTWVSGNGVIFAFGGQEALPLATLVADGHTPQDGTFASALTYSGPTTAGTAITLGQTIASGRCWLNWSFTAAITGYLQGQVIRPDQSVLNLYPATSAQAVTLQGAVIAAYSAFVNLPAQVVTWQWVPGVTNTANQSCGLTLVRG